LSFNLNKYNFLKPTFHSQENSLTAPTGQSQWHFSLLHDAFDAPLVHLPSQKPGQNSSHFGPLIIAAEQMVQKATKRRQMSNLDML
jgi:hypothetical protein